MGAPTEESGAEQASITYYSDVDGFNPVTARPLEEIWFGKLQKARKALTVASANVKALKSEYLTLPPSDGHYAYRQALATETKAQGEYNMVLRVFRHIVLNGSLPDEI
jgi:hypothetical protein